MGILNSSKEIKLDDRDIKLFLGMDSEHQIGHVVVRPREAISDNFMTHEEDEYLYLIKGTLFVKTREEQWKIKSGEWNLIPRGTEHIVENISDQLSEFVFVNIGKKVGDGLC